MPSFVFSASILAASSFIHSAFGQTYTYTLQDTYGGGVTDFYSNFNFITESDPTHGFVDYVNQSTAISSGILGYGSGNSAIWGVDNTTVLSTSAVGRASIRLEGKTNYNHGLFIADIQHMPGSNCGSWPAFWTLGNDTWPANGEMDIIEGVNLQTVNQMTAHTAPNCTMAFTDETASTTGDYDCSEATGGSAGCSVTGAPYGDTFNAGGGGVYVMQWTSAFIKLWFFSRSNIPASITAGAPDYTTFGTPLANFAGTSCNIDTHFVNHRMIFDTTFCGDWAGAVYPESSCPLASDTNGCVAYVAGYPSAFDTSYWEVNSIKVYAEQVSASTTSSSSSSSSTSSHSSTSSVTSSTSLSSSTKSTSTASTTTGSTTSSSVSSTSKTSTTSSSSSTVTTSATSSSTSKATTTTSTSSASSKTSTTTSTSAASTSTTTSKSTTLTSSTTSTSTTKSSTKASSTTSTSATPTVTSITCPGSNGDIFVSNSKRFQIQCLTDNTGTTISTVSVANLAACINKCATTSGCVNVSLSGKNCYLKSALGQSRTSTSVNGAILVS